MSDAVTADVEIVNKRGLHARASAKFVQLAETFGDVAIEVRKGADSAGGRSIMGLMLLGAGPGTTLTLTATGPRAAEALGALTELIAGRFGEEE